MNYGIYDTSVIFEVEQICTAKNLNSLLRIMSKGALRLLLDEQEKQEKYEVCKIIKDEIERR